MGGGLCCHPVGGVFTPPRGVYKYNCICVRTYQLCACHRCITLMLKKLGANAIKIPIVKMHCPKTRFCETFESAMHGVLPAALFQMFVRETEII